MARTDIAGERIRGHRWPGEPGGDVRTCHAGANASFVQYQPHANAHNRKLNPALLLHRVVHEPVAGERADILLDSYDLWLIRQRLEQVKRSRLREETMPDLEKR